MLLHKFLTVHDSPYLLLPSPTDSRFWGCCRCKCWPTPWVWPLYCFFGQRGWEQQRQLCSGHAKCHPNLWFLKRLFQASLKKRVWTHPFAIQSSCAQMELFETLPPIYLSIFGPSRMNRGAGFSKCNFWMSTLMCITTRWKPRIDWKPLRCQTPMADTTKPCCFWTGGLVWKFAFLDLGIFNIAMNHDMCFLDIIMFMFIYLYIFTYAYLQPNTLYELNYELTIFMTMSRRF